ncbi:MAG TPA: MAPEG family protein [Pseudolabrys sp.]|jgi:hypothetical protein|nr:MAPEG family protein [Pseudolabrys sp.]
MPIDIVLMPLFVEVALTFGLFCWMAYYRVTLIQSGEVHPRNVALREPNWPPHVLQIANAAHNQLEIPVLFYVLTVLAIITRHADVLFVAMAWIFVLMRIVHAYIHVTSNRVPRRGAVFGLCLLVLILMWVIFAVRILLGLP